MVLASFLMVLSMGLTCFSCSCLRGIASTAEFRLKRRESSCRTLPPVWFWPVFHGFVFMVSARFSRLCLMFPWCVHCFVYGLGFVFHCFVYGLPMVWACVGMLLSMVLACFGHAFVYGFFFVHRLAWSFLAFGYAVGLFFHGLVYGVGRFVHGLVCSFGLFFHTLSMVWASQIGGTKRRKC